LPSNDYSVFYLTHSPLLHYHGKIDQAKYTFKYTKNLTKNICDVIDCNSKKDWQILIIFGKNTSDTTNY